MNQSANVTVTLPAHTLVFTKTIFRSHGRYVPKLLHELRRIFDIANLSYYVLSPRYCKDNSYRILISVTITNTHWTTLSLYLTSLKFTQIQTKKNQYIQNPSIYGLCLSQEPVTLVRNYQEIEPIPHLICPPRGMLNVDPGSPSSLSSQGRTYIKVKGMKDEVQNGLDEL